MRQDTSAAAEPRAKLSRTGLRWALEGIVVAHLTVARVAEGLGVAWDTANNAVLAEGNRLLINDPTRFEGVKVIGVDEHVWRHTRRGDKYVTVIIDLTPVRDGAGPARLLDMVEGRSKAAFKTWLADRDDAFRDAVEVVAMDGFTGFKTAAAEEIPDAVTVMDPFHVVRLAGDALDRCRRRVQLAIHGHRGFRDDPLYKSRRTLHTGADLLTDKQSDRLRALFEGMGFADVKTLIASGNVVFESRSRTSSTIEKQIEQHLKHALGYEVATFVRSGEDIVAVANHEPFSRSELTAPGHSLYVAFVRSAPARACAAALLSRRSNFDDFRIRGREVYWLCRGRFSESPTSSTDLERVLRCAATVRNVTTVRKLVAGHFSGV